jgi:hypothetical protein
MSLRYQSPHLSLRESGIIFVRQQLRPFCLARRSTCQQCGRCFHESERIAPSIALTRLAQRWR